MDRCASGLRTADSWQFEESVRVAMYCQLLSVCGDSQHTVCEGWRCSCLWSLSLCPPATLHKDLNKGQRGHPHLCVRARVRVRFCCEKNTHKQNTLDVNIYENCQCKFTNKVVWCFSHVCVARHLLSATCAFLSVCSVYWLDLFINCLLLCLLTWHVYTPCVYWLDLFILPVFTNLTCSYSL